MKLYHLPIEILAKVLPIQDHLLKLPEGTIISWLNLLPQRQRFILLAESGIGVGEEHFGPGVLYTTLSGRKFYVRKLLGIYFYINALRERFVPLLYINFGGTLKFKYQRNMIVFSFDQVKDLMMEYYCILPFLKTCAGPDGSIVLGSIPFLTVGEEFLWQRSAVFSAPSLNDELDKLHSQILLGGDIVAETMKLIRSYTLINLVEVELNLTVQEYVEFKHNIARFDSALLLRPIKLWVDLTFDDVSVQKLQGNNAENEIGEDFPIGWITEVFMITFVKSFVLHYQHITSRFSKIPDLLGRMPLLEQVVLSFGELDIENVSKLMKKRQPCRIQINVSLGCYLVHLDQIRKEQWRIRLIDDYALLEYTKDKSRRADTLKWMKVKVKRFKKHGFAFNRKQR
ncbi:hypothetical protein KGF57_000989 [Candida theae]|uniref:Uncharacterized protein n=1 Tax=Candida theae TaxID=1198502 RepID=A0AAD5BI22_9ASCO|nr:uncharacterized protein KGF57_000989 [Candida theae]KAI5964497.1 hypothetical protein KGF57_000989 [Candida theae]